MDDNRGMLFNKRRQSRDAKVIEDIFTMTEKLWIHSFSEKLFEEESGKSLSGKIAGQIIVDDDFLNKAKKEEFCFVENQELMSYSNSIEQIVLYCWNRKYPSDFKLDLDLSNWEKKAITEFVGNSHEKITKIVLQQIK